MSGLYVHVPFCGSICSYCHFPRTADHDPDARARYVAGVVGELDLRREHCSVLREGRRPLETAYLGGGTPSQLEPRLMAELLEGTVGRLPVSADLELTAEANPETLSDEVATAWRDLGIGRVSLGVQSLDRDVLDLLGRACDPAKARAALERACRTFDRVSADWIVGPGLEEAALLAELDEAIALGVEHFSVYILELHEGTRLVERVRAGEVVLPPDPVTEALYLAVVDHLGGRGFPQYEVSNFALPGAESRHNRNYWSGRPWLGLGPGAHGYWGRRRYANQGTLAAWHADLEAGRVPESEVDPLDRSARRLERLVLGLRTAHGVALDDLAPGALDLARGEEEGLWQVVDERLVLTPRGFLRIDTIEEKLARLTP